MKSGGERANHRYRETKKLVRSGLRLQYWTAGSPLAPTDSTVDLVTVSAMDGKDKKKHVETDEESAPL